MNETIKNALILIAVVAIIIIILYLLLVKKSSVSTPTPSPTPTPSSPTPSSSSQPSSQPSPTPTPSSQPSPSSSPTSSPSSSPQPSPTPTPSPSYPIQVTSFVISNGCSGNYCWGRITFNSSITGILSEVITVYSSGSTYCWTGSYTVNQGSNTIWLDDCNCNTLSCNPPGQIIALVFVINGNRYTMPVTYTAVSYTHLTLPTIYSV